MTCRQEHYSWQQHEDDLNESVPQFRTGFQTPPPSTQVRIHFVHVRSPHPNAVPLLIIPPFPLTNLSLAHLISPITNPLDPVTQQPFHLVIPSLPGLGFSDPLPNTAPPISTTADMLDGLMRRLGYPRYLATNAGSAALSPSLIDWRLIKYMSQNYIESCLGAHFILPPFAIPRLGASAAEWTKWKLAKLLGSSLGYSKEDISTHKKEKKSKSKEDEAASLLGQLSYGDYEPNTPSYALCDSPTGLLLYVLKLLRTLGPKRELKPDDIITLTQLIWLPGPEAALRFWSHCASQIEPVEGTKPKRKPKVAITVFLGEEEQSEQKKALPRPAKSPYSCPSWAKAEFAVVHTNRVTGTPGYISWDRPEVIIDGARGLAKAVLSVDNRMKRLSQSGAIPSPRVVVEGGRSEPAALSGTTARDSAGTTAQLTPAISGQAPSTPTSRKVDPQGENRALTPQDESRALTPQEQNRTSTPQGENRALTPQGESKALTPQEEHRALTPRPLTPRTPRTPRTPNTPASPRTPRDADSD